MFKKAHWATPSMRGVYKEGKTTKKLYPQTLIYTQPVEKFCIAHNSMVPLRQYNDKEKRGPRI